MFEKLGAVLMIPLVSYGMSVVCLPAQDIPFASRRPCVLRSHSEAGGRAEAVG